MPIARDLSDLPQADPNQGVPPARTPVVTSTLAEAWYARYKANGNEEYAAAIPELPYRASSTGLRCDRALWAAINKIPESNPSGLAEAYRFNIGSLVHDDMQHVFGALGENWRSEVDVDLRSIGIPGSAHADLIRYDADGAANLVCEIKTINGFGFKRHATSFKGPPEGPRYGHVLQAGIVAAALGAPKVVIVYLAMELLSPDMARRHVDSEVGRFSAEWHYLTEDLMPMVEQERGRINRLLNRGAAIPNAEIHDPQYPAGAIIVDPKAKRWHLRDEENIIATGTTWYCDYCSYKDWCLNQEESIIETQVTL